MLNALRILSVSRSNSTSCETDTFLTRSMASLWNPLLSSRSMELSRPNLVEACDIGVVGGDDIVSLLLWASAHACRDQF